MAENNRNVCKAFKASKDRCIGCMGVCDKSMSIQLFDSTDDCKKYALVHCMKGGEGCPIAEALGKGVEVEG